MNEWMDKINVSGLSVFVSPIRQYLKMCLAVTIAGWRLMLKCKESRAETLLNALQCTGHPSTATEERSAGSVNHSHHKSGQNLLLRGPQA